MPDAPEELAKVSQLFRTFAQAECRGSSPLYERLSLGIAEDAELLNIASKGRTPIPNLFFAAVHFLLLRDGHGIDAPLARFYFSVSGDGAPSDDAFPHFRVFCLRHQSEIVDIVSTRLVQTNEVRRCSYLLPAFGLISREVNRRPIILVEVGASAGLNLRFDQYCYDYGDGRLFGSLGSLVQIRCELRGTIKPPIPQSPIPIAQRIGIDLNPIRPADSTEIAWLNALIWPEHAERRLLLRQALQLAAGTEVQLVTGDASVLIANVLASLPADAPVCVFQTHSINQFSAEVKDRMFSALDEFGSTRELFFLSRHTKLTLEHHTPAGKLLRVLANSDGHGAWLEWLDS